MFHFVGYNDSREKLKKFESNVREGRKEKKNCRQFGAQTRFRNDRLGSTNDLITANLALSWNPRNEGGNSRWLDLERHHELLSASGLPGSIIRFCSFITSARNTMTPRFCLSQTESYTPGTSIYIPCYSAKRKRGVSWRRVAPVVRCDTVQTFSLSRG